MVGTSAPGVRIIYGTGEYQFGDLRLPSGEGPHPVLIVVHGGFWRSRYGLDHIEPASVALTGALGAATWNIEYRRLGNSGGGWPGTFLDVAAAADHLRSMSSTYNLDLSRVVTIGHSAGGHLALWLAGRRRISPESDLYSASPLPVSGAVSLAGVADLRLSHKLELSNNVVVDLLGGGPNEALERYAAASPAELVPLGIRQKVVHGTEDKNVPYIVGASYAKAAQASGDDAELVTLRGAGHFEVVDPSSKEWARVVEATGELLT